MNVPVPSRARTRIKICGITRTVDARAAVDAGADALGLVFWPGTPRVVGVDQARAIVADGAAVRNRSSGCSSILSRRRFAPCSTPFRSTCCSSTAASRPSCAARSDAAT